MRLFEKELFKDSWYFRKLSLHQKVEILYIQFYYYLSDKS